jgi:lipoprotein-releasing system ATP-binding protein
VDSQDSAPAVEVSSVPVLRLEGVTKSFDIGKPNETEVLHGIDLVLKKGEFAALIGPSGSGKSTLLNIIGLLDRPTRGKLFISGQDTASLDDAALTKLRGRTIGFIFQAHYLLSAFTALENVMMPIMLERGHPDDAMREIAKDLLEKVGLTKWQNNLSSNMSGGQQQRVAIARALALQPSLILADEPTGNLDTETTQSVFELMRQVSVASGTTFLLVTHNMSLAQRCDRIIELLDGKVIADQATTLAAVARVTQSGVVINK